MTIRYGSLVGVAYSGASATPKATSPAHERGKDQVLIRDTIELSAAPANDLIWLGKFPSNTVLNPLGCKAWFDDLGTGITLDVGEGTTHIDALTDGQDVATAAGSFELLKSVDIANYFKPLWAQLGYSADPGGHLQLFAKILGGAATGTFTWQIIGQTR